jgi:hypothetical protein
MIIFNIRVNGTPHKIGRSRTIKLNNKIIKRSLLFIKLALFPKCEKVSKNFIIYPKNIF